MPEALARRLCRVLSPDSDQSTMPRPEEVTAVKLTGQIGPIEEGVVRLTGVGTWDAKTGDLLSIALYVEGTCRTAPPYDEDLRATAGAIESRKDPARRTP